MNDGQRWLEPFVAAVADAFEVGPSADVVVTAMTGSANRLWRFDTSAGTFVVKELSHDTAAHLPRRRRAAAFEQHVFEDGSVVMPAPVPARDGDVVVPLVGSRGVTAPVRVHRWLDGAPVVEPSAAVLRVAGASLHTIQQAGARWSTEPTGSIRWWDVEPGEVADRLRASPPLAGLGREAAAVAPDALALVARADRLEGGWVYSHCDHKPANALVVGGGPAVLDWDECGHCHPRLEAVEAALRWAGPEPSRHRFEAFVSGYRDAGGRLAALTEVDFGKWVAALLGWFSFQGRRALGDWPTDSEQERASAAAMAGDALAGLRRSLDALPAWATWG